MSWLSQQQHHQPQAMATSSVPIYTYQPSFYPTLYPPSTSTSSTGSLYSSGDFFHPHGTPSYHYRVYAPPASSYRSSLFSSNLLSAGSVGGGHTEEMMPSDVTPDVNGNYKRSSKLLRGQKAASVDYGSRLIGYDSLLESSSMPVIKYRDPKAEANLAMEAIRQRIEAQKQFEKEVLMLDESIPQSMTTGQHNFEMSRGNHVHNNENQDPFMMAETNKILTDKSPTASTTTFHFEDKATTPPNSGKGKIIKNLRVSTGYRIESRSDKRSNTETTKDDKIKLDNEKQEKKTTTKQESKTNKSPVMTSIEIFDIPGANHLLGLMDPPGQLKPINSTQPSLESLYQQLASLGF